MNIPSIPTRPFQVLVIGAFVLFAIIGLFLFANYHSGGAAKTGTVTIWGILPETVVNAQLGTLKQTDKSFANVNYAEKDASTFEATLADALASGTGPDMVLIDQEQLLSEKNKLSVIPYSALSQRSFLNMFVPIDELYLTDQGMYGIPVAVDPLVLYYNRSLLSSVGAAAPPATWEAVTGLAPALTKRSGGQLSRSAIALGGYGSIENARGILSLLLFQAGSPITTLSNGAVRAAIQESGSARTAGASGAQSAVSFYTQFADPAKTVYSWNDSEGGARLAFTSGTLAFYIGYASERPFITAANPNLDFDMTQVPQPGTAQSRMTYGLAYAFAIPKASRNPSGALIVARALMAKSLALSGAHALSMAPAQRALLAAPANDKYAAVYYPEALVAKGWLSPLPAVTDGIFAAMIGNIASGRNTVQEALDKAGQALDSSL